MNGGIERALCSKHCRDLKGRHSTPLHFAAGYNRVRVVEYLLQNGADVHAKDKSCHGGGPARGGGGGVPCHSSEF